MLSKEIWNTEGSNIEEERDRDKHPQLLQDLNIKITEMETEEITQVIKTAKRRKALGPDDTPMEVFKEL